MNGWRLIEKKSTREINWVKFNPDEEIHYQTMEIHQRAHNKSFGCLYAIGNA